MIEAARAAGCRFNFRLKYPACESTDTDLCRGGCPVLKEWKALLARRRPNWKPESQRTAPPARAESKQAALVF